MRKLRKRLSKVDSSLVEHARGVFYVQFSEL